MVGMEISNKENETTKSWAGVSKDEIYEGLGIWGFQTKPISPSRGHTVLFHLPSTTCPPKPHYSAQTHYWNNDYVRMPCCSKNLFPTKNENGIDEIKPRWEIIETSLLQPIKSSYEFEAAVFTYNSKLPKFSALHYFFNEVLDSSESSHFFNVILPEIITLALKLPEIIPGNIPLLKQGTSKSISLSQLQVSCLLANAFLCTFPWGKDMAETYPGINFLRLYTANLRPKRKNSVSEKLKCICHYFRRVTSEIPTGVITFERKYIHKSQIPRWDVVKGIIGNTKLHISSKGNIEDDGIGLLQVDFANKYVGGGVLGYGCVQEEIRYVICPELIVSRLFTEQLGSTEALVVTGIERFSNYKGYGDSFEWSGNYKDSTPFDDSGRRKTSVVAIDAIKFVRPADQYNPSAILRELNKAYVGFFSNNEQKLPAVATGNWGCGAFQGDTNLKFLIQLLACTAANTNMVYFTFGNAELKDSLYKMYIFLASKNITVAQLWCYLCRFPKASLPSKQLYEFIQQAHCDEIIQKRQQCRKNFYFISKNEQQNLPGTSRTEKREDIAEPQEVVDSVVINIQEDAQDIETICSNDDDIIESSQPHNNVYKKVFKRGNASSSSEEIMCTKISKSDDIIRIIDVIDEKQTVKKTERDNTFQRSFLFSLDKMSESLKLENDCEIVKHSNSFSISSKKSEIPVLENESDVLVQKRKSKITDYFSVCHNK